MGAKCIEIVHNLDGLHQSELQISVKSNRMFLTYLGSFNDQFTFCPFVFDHTNRFSKCDIYDDVSTYIFLDVSTEFIIVIEEENQAACIMSSVHRTAHYHKIVHQFKYRIIKWVKGPLIFLTACINMDTEHWRGDEGGGELRELRGNTYI